MRIHFVIIILVISLFATSCSEEETQLTTYCVDFDLRQCEGNPWLTDNQVPDSHEEHLALINTYLKEESITVLRSKINGRPDLFVCQACFVCPAGPRIRVEITAQDTAAINALDLLNITTVTCPDEF